MQRNANHVFYRPRIAIEFSKDASSTSVAHTHIHLAPSSTMKNRERETFWHAEKLVIKLRRHCKRRVTFELSGCILHTYDRICREWKSQVTYMPLEFTSSKLRNDGDKENNHIKQSELKITTDFSTYVYFYCVLISFSNLCNDHTTLKVNGNTLAWST